MNNVVMILNKNVVKSLIFITVYIMSFSCANAPTPNLEILAQNGIKFSNAYSSAPVCAP